MGRTAVLVLSLFLIDGAAGSSLAVQPAPPAPVITPPAPALSAAPAQSSPSQPPPPPVITPPPAAPKSPPPDAPKASAPDVARTYRLGLDALRAGALSRAQATATKLMKMQPSVGRQLMGLVKAKRGDLRGAVGEFDKALALDATLVSAREERAVAFSRLGEVDKARADLEALKIQAVACGKTCRPELRTAISRVEAALAAGRPPARRGWLPRRPAGTKN